MLVNAVHLKLPWSQTFSPADDLRRSAPRIGKAYTTGSIALRTKLESLGMATPFRETADLSGITDEPIHIAEVLHKAMLGIDEKGVEAAAASAAIVGGIVTAPPEYVQFDVDRPFSVGLIDGPTNTLLFAGHVVAPTD